MDEDRNAIYAGSDDDIGVANAIAAYLSSLDPRPADSIPVVGETEMEQALRELKARGAKRDLRGLWVGHEGESEPRGMSLEFGETKVTLTRGEQTLHGQFDCEFPAGANEITLTLNFEGGLKATATCSEYGFIEAWTLHLEDASYSMSRP
jgi:hypothetical protein